MDPPQLLMYDVVLFWHWLGLFFAPINLFRVIHLSVRPSGLCVFELPVHIYVYIYMHLFIYMDGWMD